MLRLIASYSWIRLEPKLSRLTEHEIPYCNAKQDDDWNYNQPVDGDEKVCMCLVDYDLADGQLAHAAGGTPSKPHEWMVSNLLSPYSSTLAMHAQSDSGGCGKLIV